MQTEEIKLFKRWPNLSKNMPKTILNFKKKDPQRIVSGAFFGILDLK